MSNTAGVPKRSVIVNGHKTSVSLEEEFWQAMLDLAQRRCLSVNALVSEIDNGEKANLSSAIRLAVLRDLQGRAKEPVA